MKISVLLPYKENFSEDYAGAVSLFVKDTVKNSKFFKSTYVFGNTNLKKRFLKNYINIDLKKKMFQSTSKNYVNEFVKQERHTFWSKKRNDIISHDSVWFCVVKPKNHLKHIQRFVFT